MDLTELPQKITVGDTVTWDETLSEYPADESWVLIYSFTSHFAQFKSTHVAVGADHEVTIDTTDLEPGEYDYTKKVDDTSEVFTLEAGVLTVLADLSADTAGVDRRSYAEITLENIEAILKGKATKDQTSYSLNGRALSRYSPEDLNEWRASLKVEVADERRQVRRDQGGRPHTNVRSRFSSEVN